MICTAVHKEPGATTGAWAEREREDENAVFSEQAQDRIRNNRGRGLRDRWHRARRRPWRWPRCRAAPDACHPYPGDLGGLRDRGEGLAGRLASLGDPGAAGSSRWPIWRATWALIQEAPWLGHGPGTFFQAYAAYRLPTDGTAGFFAHNDYLQYLAERGLPGLLLLLALAAGCAWLYMRGLRDRAPVAALAGAAVHTLFSYNLHIMPFVIVFGIAIAALETAVPSAAGFACRCASSAHGSSRRSR